MKKVALVIVVALLVAFGAVLAIDHSSDYHLGEFERIKTNFNTYRPSFADRLRGIENNQGKWDSHLLRLEAIGAIQRKTFVFTEVPYTRENSSRIWRAAMARFTNAVMVTASYYDTNAPGYGVTPYVLNVWDFPEQMPRWSAFFETNNHR